eukprot:3093411-Prymnesium_polylepis.1
MGANRSIGSLARTSSSTRASCGGRRRRMAHATHRPRCTRLRKHAAAAEPSHSVPWPHAPRRALPWPACAAAWCAMAACAAWCARACTSLRRSHLLATRTQLFLCSIAMWAMRMSCRTSPSHASNTTI